MKLNPVHSLPEAMSSIKYFVLDLNTDLSPFRIAFDGNPRLLQFRIKIEKQDTQLIDKIVNRIIQYLIHYVRSTYMKIDLGFGI